MKKALIISNIITIVILIGILLIDNYPKIIIKNIETFFTGTSIPKTKSFTHNPFYEEAIDFYTVYTGQKNIVMLGTSLTSHISWVELIGRDDIANRGVGSDITKGFVNRLYFVLNVKPKICFIEGGVNDLAYNINNETIIENLNTLVDTLLKTKPPCTESAGVVIRMKFFPHSSNIMVPSVSFAESL